MGWSYEDNRIEVTACEPKRASAGQPVTVAIEGYNRGAQRADEDGWYALLVPIDHGAPAIDAPPAHVRATKVSYRHGGRDRFAVDATFEVPAEARGPHQLVLGRDDAGGSGEQTRFLVDADDFDGAFVIA